MPESITIARPYAKAVFEHALSGGQLSEWSQYLSGLVRSLMDEQVIRFIDNPATTSKQHSELLTAALTRENGPLPQDLDNFIQLSAAHKRLMALPEIGILFERMRALHEKTMVVNVTSYSELSAGQQQQLVEALSKRLQRQIKLDITIDKSLIGGAVINAGDIVIDGSVRHNLNELKTQLAVSARTR